MNIELVPLSVKKSLVGSDRDIFVSVFSGDRLGFAAVPLAKLEQRNQFVKVVSYLS